MGMTGFHDREQFKRYRYGSAENGFEFGYQQTTGHKTIQVRPWMALTSGLLIVALLAWSLSVTGYVVFRDQVIRSVVDRHVKTVDSYEDQLSTLRHHIEALSAKRFVNQEILEEKLDGLTKRQRDLETQQKTLKDILSQADSVDLNETTIKAAMTAVESLGAVKAAFNEPTDVSSTKGSITLSFSNSFGSIPGVSLPAFSPAALASSKSSRFQKVLVGEEGDPLAREVNDLDTLVASMETHQARLLTAVEDAAKTKLNRLKEAMSNLPAETAHLVETAEAQAYDGNGLGGPFIPANEEKGAEKSLFIKQSARVADLFRTIESYQQAFSVIPIKRPIATGYRISSRFGPRRDPFLKRRAMHSGIDFAAPTGTTVRSPAKGVVTKARWLGGYGRLVEIDHGNGIKTRFGHLSRMSVKKGQTVEQGQPIAKVGNTGRSTGPHLHYEVWMGGKPVNPMRFLQADM